MNKKERLLNLAKEKFERSNNVELLLLTQYIISSDEDRFYLETTPIILKDIEDLQSFISDFDNNLIRKTLEIDFDNCKEDFEKFKVSIAKNGIIVEDECIQAIYWQSSEDRKILEDN